MTSLIIFKSKKLSYEYKATYFAENKFTQICKLRRFYIYESNGNSQKN